MAAQQEKVAQWEAHSEEGQEVVIWLLQGLRWHGSQNTSLLIPIPGSPGEAATPHPFFLVGVPQLDSAVHPPQKGQKRFSHDWIKPVPGINCHWIKPIMVVSFPCQ